MSDRLKEITKEELMTELYKTGWLTKGDFSIYEEHRINGVDVVYDVLKRLEASK